MRRAKQSFLYTTNFSDAGYREVCRWTPKKKHSQSEEVAAGAKQEKSKEMDVRSFLDFVSGEIKIGFAGDPPTLLAGNSVAVESHRRL